MKFIKRLNREGRHGCKLPKYVISFTPYEQQEG